MKKLLLILVCLFIFTGCENTKLNPVDKNQPDTGSTGTTDVENEYFKTIGLEEFKELYASDKPTLIYFGASFCSACQSFKPIAQQFAKENEINVYFLQTDASDFTQDDATELNSIVEFQYIPFITIYKNKELLYSEAGVHSLDKLQSLATEYGL